MGDRLARRHRGRSRVAEVGPFTSLNILNLSDSGDSATVIALGVDADHWVASHVSLGISVFLVDLDSEVTWTSMRGKVGVAGYEPDSRIVLFARMGFGVNHVTSDFGSSETDPPWMIEAGAEHLVTEDIALGAKLVYDRIESKPSSTTIWVPFTLALYF